MAAHRHACRLPALLVAALVLFALVVSACGGGGGSSGKTGETGSIEAQLKEAVTTAASSCGKLAEALPAEAAEEKGESACESVQESLEAEVESAASTARGSASAAFEALVEKCRDAASELSFGEGAALKLCEEVEQLQTG